MEAKADSDSRRGNGEEFRSAMGEVILALIDSIRVGRTFAAAGEVTLAELKPEGERDKAADIAGGTGEGIGEEAEARTGVERDWERSQLSGS